MLDPSSSRYPPFSLSSSSAAHRALHSFPTRRSSDLSSFGSQPVWCFTGSPTTFFQLPNSGLLPDKLRRNKWRGQDRKSTRLNSSHVAISYAVFCLKKKTRQRVGGWTREDDAAYRPAV